MPARRDIAAASASGMASAVNLIIRAAGARAPCCTHTALQLMDMGGASLHIARAPHPCVGVAGARCCGRQHGPGFRQRVAVRNPRGTCRVLRATY
ncbi:unnamed protein product (plasmid) [Mycetohabitans rhizoxinica HKI 454]|uniref:Uncharacterized protein n=1 Tax=Mycetohabitans rhizoxinica (strain DSM 19002 / CIP 109453 / HKI 454) TaxID=882378 RepID=E5ATP4_MYCRK|nr:unnamed protein product [Mycetohabitans rhizoxinica HKI 454]